MRDITFSDNVQMSTLSNTVRSFPVTLYFPFPGVDQHYRSQQTPGSCFSLSTCPTPPTHVIILRRRNHGLPHSDSASSRRIKSPSRRRTKSETRHPRDSTRTPKYGLTTRREHQRPSRSHSDISKPTKRSQLSTTPTVSTHQFNSRCTYNYSRSPHTSRRIPHHRSGTRKLSTDSRSLTQMRICTART